jgi:hypothetical protein
MDSNDGRRAGVFQWSAGGWFGSQLGATLWPLVVGIVVRAHDRSLGVVLLALALLPTAVGILLWQRRRIVSPYPALQILLAFSGLSALLAVIAVHLAGLSPTALGLPPVWLLVLYPALMLVLHRREQAARRAAA